MDFSGNVSREFSVAFRTATNKSSHSWLFPKCSFQKQLFPEYSQKDAFPKGALRASLLFGPRLTFIFLQGCRKVWEKLSRIEIIIS